MQPDPVRFVQLTTQYWEEFGPAYPGWMNLPYHPPPGCVLTNTTCPPDRIEPEAGVVYCQVAFLTSVKNVIWEIALGDFISSSVLETPSPGATLTGS